MEKETSCINSKAILDYIRDKQIGSVSELIRDLHPEIDSLPDPEGFLRDPNNWISCETISRLYERARRMVGEDRTAFLIAKHAIQNSSLGYAQRIIFKGFWSTNNVLKNLQKINDKWNRNKVVEVVGRTKKGAVVRLHWNPRMKSSKDMCLYNKGAYTYLPVIWGGKPVKVTERCCFFDGAPYCEYDLEKATTNRFYEIFARVFTSKSVLVETIREMENDKKIIEQKYEEVNQLNRALNYKIRQLMAIQETGKAILSVLDLDQLLTVIMNLLSNVCRIDRAIIMLVNEEEGYLDQIHGVGFDGNVPDEISNYRIPLDRVSNILVRVSNTGRSEYVPDVSNSNLRKDNIILTRTRPSSVFVVPLITRAKVIGVIATDAVDGNGVPKETRETLEVFAPQIAIAIENARLYRKLQEQMKELKRSHDLLSRAEKFSFLGNLAARLAHEIKNPMTAIGTFIQMLPKKYDDEKFRDGFQKLALEETERVNRLITELLDLVKPRKSNFELSGLHGLIDKMILLLSPQSKAKGITIETRYDPDIGLVWMDPEKIKEVVLNLLSNALEFTPDGGKIDLETRNLDERGSTPGVSIEIRDSGKGIPESDLTKIFDPYFTTKHKSEMHSGTGLGLFIAHQNIQAHGGTIVVHSRPDEGTRFMIKIPKKPADDAIGRPIDTAHADR
jgi:signal transduction histidine kinase